MNDKIQLNRTNPAKSIMKTKDYSQWTIRLKVSSEERKSIHKEAIENGLSIAEYVKFKLLHDSSMENSVTKGKSA